LERAVLHKISSFDSNLCSSNCTFTWESYKQRSPRPPGWIFWRKKKGKRGRGKKVGEKMKKGRRESGRDKGEDKGKERVEEREKEEFCAVVIFR